MPGDAGAPPHVPEHCRACGWLPAGHSRVKPLSHAWSQFSAHVGLPFSGSMAERSASVWECAVVTRSLSKGIGIFCPSDRTGSPGKPSHTLARPCRTRCHRSRLSPGHSGRPIEGPVVPLLISPVDRRWAAVHSLSAPASPLVPRVRVRLPPARLPGRWGSQKPSAVGRMARGASFSAICLFLFSGTLAKALI